MNKEKLFAYIRKSGLFGAKLRQGVVDTVNTILKECAVRGVTDYRMIAYILATAYHESYNTARNPEWLPIREGFAANDSQARAHVVSLLKSGKIKQDYSLPNRAGLSFYGRGWVQISWEENYESVSQKLNIPIWQKPDLALDRRYAAPILVVGMNNGWFTGRKLSHYITAGNTDWIGARATVNGTDRAQDIANTALIFYKSLILL